MNKITTRASLILLLFQIIAIGCGEKISTGPLIGKIEDNTLSLIIPWKKFKMDLQLY
mgnify:FL=1